MRGQLPIGRAFGIPIGLHYSSGLLAAMLLFSVSAHFATRNESWSPALMWMVSAGTALFFFASLLVHELGHAVVAIRRGMRVQAITLFALGGVVQIDDEPPSPTTELLVAIAGPLVSVGVGVGCLGGASALGWSPDVRDGAPAAAMLGWLGYINVSLALFNLVPGYPLDGGRVLRAALWAGTGDRHRATRMAARSGWVIACTLLLFGLLTFLQGRAVAGLWIAMIGWFLLQAAQAADARANLLGSIDGVAVGDIMARDCEVLSPVLSVQEFVDGHLLRSRARCFIVGPAEAPVGLMTLNEVGSVPREDWNRTRVSDVMRRFAGIETVAVGSSAADALTRMGRVDVNQLPVVSGGRVEGIVTRAHIVRLLLQRAGQGA